MEAWTPSWTVCVKEHEAPDSYLHLLRSPHVQHGVGLRLIPCWWSCWQPALPLRAEATSGQLERGWRLDELRPIRCWRSSGAPAEELA